MVQAGAEVTVLLRLAKTSCLHLLRARTQTCTIRFDSHSLFPGWGFFFQGRVFAGCLWFGFVFSFFFFHFVLFFETKFLYVALSVLEKKNTVAKNTKRPASHKHVLASQACATTPTPSYPKHKGGGGGNVSETRHWEVKMVTQITHKCGVVPGLQWRIQEEKV